MRSFSLSESSSDVVRSIGASAFPYLLILGGESTSILTASMLSLSLLSSPSSKRTSLVLTVRGPSRAGRVDTWGAGSTVLRGGSSRDGDDRDASAPFDRPGAKSFRTCRLSSLSSLSTFTSFVGQFF